MKKLSIPEIGFIYIGSFLGAGFVSGQELWQFFGSFGMWGIAGLLIAACLFVFLGTVLFSLTAKSGICEMDKIAMWRDIRWLRTVIAVVEISFMFGIYIIMASGAGTTAAQLTGIAVIKPIICFVFCIIVTLIALSGVNGVVKLFSFVIPPVTILSFAIGVISLKKTGIHIGINVPGSPNPLIGNWVLAALTFVSYNFFCGIGVMTAIGGKTGGGGRGFKGALFGGMLIIVIAASIIIPLMSSPYATDKEIPMLALTKMLHPIFTYIYADLLFIAMLGASLSVFVPIPMYFSRFAFFSNHKKLFAVILSLIAFIGSMAGFGNLISVVYSVYGYIASVIIILMVIHYFKIRNA